MSNNSPKNKESDISSFISPKLCLQNIKYFLEMYKTSKKISLFSEKFLKECPLYTEESEIPASFDNLNRPFDRNKVFYIPHGPYVGYRKSYSYSFKNYTNYYPRYPLILSSTCELISKLSKKKSNYAKTNCDEKDEKNGIVEKGENDFMLNDIPNKVWIMKLIHENISCQYGPYSSKVIFQFLKYYYMPLNQQEQKKMNLLISDLMYDIYYQPETLYQLLQDEFGQNKK